jgi:hypothetical protein
MVTEVGSLRRMRVPLMQRWPRQRVDRFGSPTERR